MIKMEKQTSWQRLVSFATSNILDLVPQDISCHSVLNIQESMCEAAFGLVKLATLMTTQQALNYVSFLFFFIRYSGISQS